MENIFIKQLELDADFDYKSLYSGDKSSSYDVRLKSLLKGGLVHKEIIIKKYLIADNIAEELDKLEEWKEMSHKKIKSILKDWHSESDYSLIPLLYILERLESNFTVKPDEVTKIYSIQSEKNIEIGYRFALQDAFAHIYMPDERAIINLTSDRLSNLVNCLIIDEMKIYLLHLEWINGTPDRIVAYELSSSQRFKDVKNNSDDTLISGLF
jgi:hypothetical protein